MSEEEKEKFLDYIKRECVEYIHMPYEFKGIAKMRNGETLEIPDNMILEISDYMSPILNLERRVKWKK